MDRPCRNRKAVNYSDFADDDDEDFAEVKAPPSKKCRVKEHESQKSKKSSTKSSSQESATHLKGCPLKADTPQPAQVSAVLLSNCSVDGSCMGLDKITSEQASPISGSRQRKSRAIEHQEPVLQEEKGKAGGEDHQTQYTPDSDSDEDFSDQEESEDEEFTVKKTEKKKTSRKEQKAPPQTSSKQKKPPKPTKGKGQLKVFLIDSLLPISYFSSLSSPAESRSPAMIRPVPGIEKSPTTPPLSKPALSVSPAAGRLPKWNPPGQIGRSPGSLQSVPVKSPGQGLRLGLSRLARVKPLHPSAVAH
ncbi:RAD51-associated protein 1 [Chanos chanos]|uniref:RAD51-associated protein 1 n=1 Tax=Chanos chanos TaxID=29144 RepID=A0A6J2V3T6_CHACN|nr:RAD51-associated protein 1 [Chanos chanos]